MSGGARGWARSRVRVILCEFGFGFLGGFVFGFWRFVGFGFGFLFCFIFLLRGGWRVDGHRTRWRLTVGGWVGGRIGWGVRLVVRPIRPEV